MTVRGLMLTLVAVGFGALLVVVFVMMPRIASADRQHRRRRMQSAVVGPFDELFHPLAHQAHIAWEVETSMPARAPIPGDKAESESALADGIIVIRVDAACATPPVAAGPDRIQQPGNPAYDGPPTFAESILARSGFVARSCWPG